MAGPHQPAFPLTIPAPPPTVRPWSLDRGATVLPDGGVRFSVWAPRARRVVLRIETGPARGDHPMQPSEEEPGVFTAAVDAAAAGEDYGYLLDSSDWLLPDPSARWLPNGVHGTSRVVDPSAFHWSDDGWRGLPLADYAIYELHVGTFTESGTFAGVVSHLRELRELGVTAIELMPVAQFPGTRNWGYDGVGLYAVQDSYGGPEELKRLVNAAHAEGLAVVLDVVYNHLGPEGNYLDAFGPYFTEKYRTPWGRALNYDDADSDPVRRWVINNALYWVTEYHVDGLRLDAVHGIFDFSATHLLAELTRAVHEQAERLGRRVVVVAESDLNDPRLLRAPSEHGYGLDAQWSDDFHHAVHSLLTGERAGYYADFGGVDHLARALREPFVYAGQFSEHRRRRHGAPSGGLPRERFVVAVQNHDQVGNRAHGDRLSTILTPAKLRVAAALLLLAPYVPLLFMGEEYGETAPFQYFVSHGDPALVEAVRKGRLDEFASFGWDGDVPDPQAEETFLRSRLDRTAMERPEHQAILRLYRELLALRHEEPMLRPGGAVLTVDHGDDGWLTMLREPTVYARYEGREEDAGLLALFNLSDASRQVPVPDGATGEWSLRLATEGEGYGGAGFPVDRIEPVTDEPMRLIPRDAAQRRAVAMPPWSAAVFQRTL